MRKLLRRLDAYTLTAFNPPRPMPAGGSGRQPAEPGPRQRRRLDRRERRRLAAELAEYRSPAERVELELILARHTDEDVREIEDLLPPRLH